MYNIEVFNCEKWFTTCLLGYNRQISCVKVHRTIRMHKVCRESAAGIIHTRLWRMLTWHGPHNSCAHHMERITMCAHAPQCTFFLIIGTVWGGNRGRNCGHTEHFSCLRRAFVALCAVVYVKFVCYVTRTHVPLCMHAWKYVSQRVYMCV